MTIRIFCSNFFLIDSKFHGENDDLHGYLSFVTRFSGMQFLPSNPRLIRKTFITTYSSTSRHIFRGILTIITAACSPLRTIFEYFLPQLSAAISVVPI